MTRKKVKLVWIWNNTARKASLKKRRLGLCKKVQELTTLCGIPAFIIIYSPDEAEPMIWPSGSEVEEMMARFQRIPELMRYKKMMSQDSYLKERMAKIEELTNKDSKKNREIELSYLMNKLNIREFDCNRLDLGEAQYLTPLIEERMEDIRKRVSYVQQTLPVVPVVRPLAQVAPPLSLLLPPPPPPSLEDSVQQGGSGGFKAEVTPQPPSFEEMVQKEVGVFRANPTDSMMWEQWFLEMVRKGDNVAGDEGSGSGSRAPRTPPPPRPPLFGGGGGDVGALGLGLPSTGRNPYFDLATLTPPNPNRFGIGLTLGDLANMTPPTPNPFGIGLTPVDFGGSSSNANLLGFEPTQPRAIVSSSATEDGLFGYFATGNELVGLPWSPNMSP